MNVLAGRRINPVNFKQEIYTSINLHDGRFNQWKQGKLNLTKFDISNPLEADSLSKILTDFRTQNDDQKSRTGDKNGFLTKSAALSLDVAIQLADVFRNPNTSSQDAIDARFLFAEVIAAFNYNFQYPIQEQIWILAFPFKILAGMNNPIMSKKAAMASNLDPNDELNPVDSTFWRKPRNISDLNMYYAFNGSANPRFDEPCTYQGPKTGFGVHGGFALSCQGKIWKFKFGNETKTEPFNSRIAWALGYNVTPVDYAEAGVKVVFDSKIISEYNSRKELTTKLKSAIGFTYKKLELQSKLNPFKNAIQAAILNNGEYISSEILEERYPQLEKEIKYLVLKEASVEAEDKNEKNLGPWGWEDFDHRDRRELRGFGVLAAFLNLFDLRTDNNRLRIRWDENGNASLLHYVSDLGSGLGVATNVLHNRNGEFDELPWQFIRRQPVNKPPLPFQKGGPPDKQSEFALIGYNVLEDIETFRRIQLEDARWMARMIAQLSENQITDALIAAGLDAAETSLVLEKLLSRRQGMLMTFGLEKEFPLVMERKLDKNFYYDPEKDPLPLATGSRDQVRAKIGKYKIIKGHLKKPKRLN